MEIYETERNNTLLARDDSFVAWLNLGGNRWLEVSWCPDNDPAMHVQTMERTQEQLAAHINTNCYGWYVCECNIDGVNVDVSGSVADPEECADAAM